MELIKTEIPGVFILEPKVFGDSRGYFFESFSQRDFNALTGRDDIVFVHAVAIEHCFAPNADV